MKLMFVILSAFVMSWSIASSVSSASEEMVLKLETVQDEYVIREPVKFILTLSNNSNDTLRIVEASGFQMWKPGHFYMEIITPRKERQYRHVILANITSIANYNYTGEPLPPGKTGMVRDIMTPLGGSSSLRNYSAFAKGHGRD